MRISFSAQSPVPVYSPPTAAVSSPWANPATQPTDFYLAQWEASPYRQAFLEAAQTTAAPMLFEQLGNQQAFQNVVAELQQQPEKMVPLAARALQGGVVIPFPEVGSTLKLPAAEVQNAVPLIALLALERLGLGLDNGLVMTDKQAPYRGMIDRSALLAAKRMLYVQTAQAPGVIKRPLSSLPTA